MKIKIHRGQNQIGGSIIEISAENAKIILDAGSELDEGVCPAVPRIDGLFCGNAKYNAVFITHYHTDHVGLAGKILRGIPIYMGEKAFEIMSASNDWRNIKTGFSPSFMKNRESVSIGDMTVTPLSCDHSAFDSYMLLVRCGSKKILYTGDFRGNGLIGFDEFLKNLPTVDALIIEGTTLSRDSTSTNIKEKELEDIGVNTVKSLKNSAAPCFIYCSSTNIERVMTARNIAGRTGRIFLEDIYTAQIAACSGINDIAPKNGEIYAFILGGDKEHNALKQFSYDATIKRDSIAKKHFLMTVRPSMKRYLEKLSEKISFEGGVLFYALWHGYKKEPYVREFIDFMKSKGLKVKDLHTSGHADSQTINELVSRVSPKIIIPVHTENSEYFKEFSHNSKVILSCNETEI